MFKRILFVVINVAAITAATLIAFSLANDSRGKGGQHKFDLKEFVEVFAGGVGIIGFFDAGLVWLFFTRKEKKEESSKKKKEVFERFLAVASGYYSAIQTCLISEIWDESLANKAKQKMAELNGVAEKELTRIQRKVWIEFYQEGINLVSDARKLKGVKERETFWQNNIAAFSKKLRYVQNLAAY